MVIFTDVSGQTIGPFEFLTPAVGTDRLSRKVQQKYHFSQRNEFQSTSRRKPDITFPN